MVLTPISNSPAGAAAAMVKRSALNLFMSYGGALTVLLGFFGLNVLEEREEHTQQD